jgi:diacylglycerol kinase (ATP)
VEPHVTPGPIQVIANPNSGAGKANRLLPRVERGLEAMGLSGTIHRTREPGHATELARTAARDGVSRILVLGGDGTIHEVANGLLDPGTPRVPPIAVLPVGTGNDFHRMVRGGKGVEGALETLQKGIPRAFDVGRVRWEGGQRYFVNLLGVGVDTEVLRRREGMKWLSGVRQYLAAVPAALVRFRCIPLTVELRGKGGGSRPDLGEADLLKAEVLLAAVTVGPSVGGGFFLSPGAQPDDGLLDLFVAERLTLFQVMRYIPRVLRGTLGRAPRIHTGQVSDLVFRSSDGRPLAFELDGEVMPLEVSCLEIDIRPACLPVLELREGAS